MQYYFGDRPKETLPLSKNCHILNLLRVFKLVRFQCDIQKFSLQTRPFSTYLLLHTSKIISLSVCKEEALPWPIFLYSTPEV